MSFKMTGKCVLSVLTLALGCYAQSASTSSLNGTVLDSQGAAISGARVTVQNVENGSIRETTTSNTGQYLVGNLVPGSYNVSVEAPGFKKTIASKVPLDIATATTHDFKLEVGAVETSIEVSGEAPPLQTEDASLGNVIEEDSVRRLPSLGRQATQLLTLQPGATLTGEVAGAKYDQTTISLDGVAVQDMQNGSAFRTSIPVPVESVQEFRTIVSNANASMATTSGAQVVLQTKRGSNQWHGSEYEFFRNDYLDANTWTLNRTGQKRPEERDNRYGTSLGGPLRHNRTFFFFLFEGRQRISSTTATRLVPSDTLRQGILQFRDSTGVVHQISPATYDPRGIGASPAILKYLSLYPEGNDPAAGGADGLNTMGLVKSIPTPIADNFGLLRVDHTFSSNWTFDGSARLDSLYQGNANQLSLISVQSLSKAEFHPRYFTGAITGIITPSLTNRIQYDYNQDRQASLTSNPQGLAGLNSPIDLAGTLLDEPVDNATASGSVISRTQIKTLSFQQLSDNLTWQKRSHQVQAGFAYYGLRSDALRTDIGNYLVTPTVAVNAGSFNVIPAAQRPTFIQSSDVSRYNSLYSALLGLVDSVNVGGTRNGSLQANPPGTPLITDASANLVNMYIQDSWKIKPTLTITLGLTYQWQKPPVEEQGRFAMEVDPATMQPIDPLAYIAQKEAAALAGQTSNPQVGFASLQSLKRNSVFNTNYLNFSPRTAVAWNPNFTGGVLGKLFGQGKTVIRGGYDRMYDFTNFTTTVTLPQLGIGFAETDGLNGPLNAAGQPYRIGLDGAIPLPGIANATSPIVPANNFSQTVSQNLDPNLPTPYAHVVDFTIQRELGNSYVLELSYVGRFGRHLYSNVNLNSVPYMMKDPASGQTLAQAFDAVATQLRAGVAPANVTPQPFFENFLPGKGTKFLATNQSASFTNGALSDLALYIDRNAPARLNNPQVLDLDFRVANGWSNYNAGIVTLRKRYAAGLTIQANYTFSHSLDTLSTIQNGTTEFSTSYNPSFDYGSSSFDRRHIFNGLFVYDLPFGKGRRFGMQNRFVDTIFGGWYWTGIFSGASGVPLLVAEGSQVFGGSQQGNTGSVGAVPIGSMDYQTGVNSSNGSGTVGTSGNAAKGGSGLNLFSNPAAVYGNFRPVLISTDTRNVRDAIRGFPYWNLDSSIGKKFTITERFRAGLEMDVFNVFNNVNFANPTLSFTNPASFGVVTSQFTTGGTDGLGQRRVQLGLRLDF